MHRCPFPLPAFLPLLFLWFFSQDSAGGQHLEYLWKIGELDGQTSEFCLGPSSYSHFDRDPAYLVGISTPGKDWPYIHPGPADLWAGGRSHRFSILFSLEEVASEGECRLLVEIADTHPALPPKIEVAINGRTSIHQTPPGGSGASVWGDLSEGKHHRIEIPVQAGCLVEGDNEIAIATLEGSWMLYDCVGLRAPGGFRLGKTERRTRVTDVKNAQLLIERDGTLEQVVRVAVQQVGPPVEGRIRIGDAEPMPVSLETGDQRIEVGVPAVEEATLVQASLDVGGEPVWQGEVVLEPVRRWEVYLLPHSHVDIGYTQLQSVVESQHWQYFEDVIEAVKRAEDHPEGARFKWNVEVLWAVDSYLRRATPEQQEAFLDAVRDGLIGLDALYGNELTGLCRPEELVRLTDLACRLRDRYGVAIDSAMISDVPGYTWSIVPVLANSGIRYFSIGPNVSARIGYTLTDWGDRPFYWVSQSGREKVLCWVAGNGYSWFHAGRTENDPRIANHLESLKNAGYPYEIVQARYSIGGDNGPPDFSLCDYVREWNARYAYPQLRIATTREMFEEFEKRYSDRIPSVQGDFTPYWEDGAASSARETALNRETAERLVQAEAVWAMLDPANYPDEEFYQAWRNAILYDEHTWGAHNSITEPDGDFAKDQWYVKQAFAVDADEQSRALLERALSPLRKPDGKVGSLLVMNASSWPRTDVVLVSSATETTGDRVTDASGSAVLSQRLTTGELAFLAEDIPPFGAKRFHVGPGPLPTVEDAAHVEGARLFNSHILITVDETTGAISSFRDRKFGRELVNAENGLGVNDYFYVTGSNPADATRNGPVTISVGERGPLVASLVVNSTAPGCYHLTREIRVFHSLDRVDLVNNVNKRPIREKEGVHFAFPFQVPEGVMRMDIGWGAIRPDADQIPGACKNWFTVQRWVDVSNQDYGIAWATLDAPLVEAGNITAETPWIRRLGPAQTFYSYVMNNYWFTNYKADQEDETFFRYSIWPHGRFDSAGVTRFGMERSQPLLVIPVDDATTEILSFLRPSSNGVVVSALKPSRDGQGFVVRLYGASGRPETLSLESPLGRAMEVRQSDLSESKGPPMGGNFEVPPFGMVTVRLDLRPESE